LANTKPKLVIYFQVNSQGQYTPVKKQVTTGWAARQKAEKEIREKLKQQENAKSSNSSS
jgi:hypothetical protein